MDAIDTIIAEGVAASAENAQSQTVAETNPQNEQAEIADETGEGQAKEPVKLTPEQELDKLRRAKSRDDRKIGKLTAIRHQSEQRLLKMEAELAKIQQGGQQQKPFNGEPKEADYQNYADYLEARNDWKLDQRLAERDTKQTQTQQTEQEQRWTSERETHVSTKAQELAKELPELPALVEEYADVVDDYSPELKRLFLEADNAPLAFFNLAKEGKIEALATMSLSRAAMEIGRAQTQAAVKPQTKAPKPLPAARGSVAASKSLDDMSGDEMRSWLKSS